MGNDAGRGVNGGLGDIAILSSRNSAIPLGVTETCGRNNSEWIAKDGPSHRMEVGERFGLFRK